MPTMKLVPSTYYLSSSTYLSVSNAANMYNDTDNAAVYATVTNSQTGTTSYYIYLRGFNFDDIPANAVVSSFSINLRARETGISTSSSYSPKLCNNTSQLTSTCTAISTTNTVNTFTGYSLDWEDLVNYGSNFGIRINCRRASRNTTGYMYIYGADIEVTYTVPNPRTITTTLIGDGTISPSGATTSYDDEEFELTITPTVSTAEVTVVKDSVDVTSQLVTHYVPGMTSSDNTVLGTYTHISGSFNSGESWFEGIVGNGYDTSDKTTSNYYSGSSSTQCVFQYAVPFSIPSGAEVTRLYMMANGHAESTSQSSEYMTVQLKSVDTEFTEQYNFKSAGTSNTTVTVTADTLPTASELTNLVVEVTLGYYGGAINGVTVFVEYAIPTTEISHYTYTYTVSGDATIAVTIGGVSDKFWVKTDSIKEFISSKTNSDRDDSIPAWNLLPTDFEDGDTLLVEGSFSGYYSDARRVSDFQVHCEFQYDLTYNTGKEYYCYDESKGNAFRCRIYVTIGPSQSPYLSINPSGQWNYNSSWVYLLTTGTLSLYRLSSGGWVETVKVYKKTSSGWVEQTDLTTVIDQNTKYVKG